MIMERVEPLFASIYSLWWPGRDLGKKYPDLYKVKLCGQVLSSKSAKNEPKQPPSLACFWLFFCETIFKYFSLSSKWYIKHSQLQLQKWQINSFYLQFSMSSSLSLSLYVCTSLSASSVSIFVILQINCQKGHMRLWQLCSALKMLISKSSLSDSLSQ